MQVTVSLHRARARRALAGRAALLAAAILLAAVLAGAVSAGAQAREAPKTQGLTTTGPIPPANVRPATGARRAVAAAGEVVVAGVPAYIWHDGCAPTSTGMVLGYWDGHGFPDLIPGDASTPTAAAYQAIASHGTPAAPGHYEDYALPTDSGGALKPDKSEPPAGDEHASDSVADFMETSWSADGLAYGWSYTNMVGPAFTSFAELRVPGVTATAIDYYTGSYGSWAFTFAVLQQEVDAGRPMVLFVDCNGDGSTDHAVAGIGYRETNGYPEYACWDTWSTAMRWQRFRDVSSSYAWGVSGGTALALTAGTPPPVVDVTAPFTSVDGAGTGWRRTPAALVLNASDAGSGVDFIEAELDGAGLTRLPGLPGTLEVSGQGVHTVRYRATDKDGNVEATRSLTVRIDAEAPVTSARAASVLRGARVTLRYRVVDLTPKAKVRLVVRTLAGHRVATLKLGARRTNTLRVARWRCKLPRGAYLVTVYATDQAGNRQATAGSAHLTVR